MTELGQRRTGRPPKVSAEAILDAAALVPAEDLTLTDLAATLGISVKTVYYYFPNRSALLTALTARTLAMLEPPDFNDCGDWQEALRRTGRWTYRTMRNQPLWALQDAGSVLTSLSHVLMPCLEVLHRGGFGKDEAMAAVVLVSNFAGGMAAAAQNTERVGGLSPGNARAWIRTVTEEESAAAVADVLSSRSIDEWFESALELAIAGAARRR